MNKINSIFIVLLSIVMTANAQVLKIEEVRPTAFFKRTNIENKLEQVAWVKIANTSAVDVACNINVDGKHYSATDFSLKEGNIDLEILLPDIEKSAKVEFIIENRSNKRQLAQWEDTWQPQKKWTIHCVTYSHQDLGYGDIPHRLRRENRIENMELMLKYCMETDSWPDDSKYRAVLETSEPITTFLSFCNKEKAEELKQRINEGRIQISGIHTLVYTEMLGHEMMARLFYLSNRHAVDMLGIKPPTSLNFDDVIGITLPFFTFAKEAGIKNLFHGYNIPA